MKTIHYLLITLLSLVSLCQAQAQAQVQAQALTEYTKYSEHDLWQDSYPVYDAATYKGKYYVIQNYDYGIIRLVQFNVSVGTADATIQDTYHWDLSNHLSFYSDQADVELVEYHDALYIYGYIRTSDGGRQHIANKLVVDNNGNATLSKVPIPPFMKGTGNNPGMAATVYKGSLCLFYVEEDSHEVRMGFTKNPEQGDSSWQTKKAIDQVVYSSNILTQDTWDVCTWFGDVKKGNETKKVELLVFGLIAGPNMWAYTFDGNPEDSDHGKWTSTPKYNGAPEQLSFSLKMLQGNITGVGSDLYSGNEDNNPIQYIYAIRKPIVTGNIHHREIQTQEFFPSSNKFGTNDNVLKTNLPYGYFGASTMTISYNGVINVNDSTLGATVIHPYQQYICILRGTCDNHFNTGSHYALIKSNRINVTSCNVPNDEMLRDKELRKLCTLSGVIEGAPPVIVDNAELYKQVPTLSTITLGQEEKKTHSESTTTGFSIDAGLGPDLDLFTLQAIGGYELQENTGEEATFTITSKRVISNNSYEMARLGCYIYLLPKLDRYSSVYFNSDGSCQSKGRPVLYSFVQTGMNELYINYPLDDEKISPMIRVEEPTKLESWEKRGKDLFRFANNDIILFDEEINSLQKVEKGLKSSVTNSSSSTESFHVGGNLVTPALQIEGNYKFSVSKSTTSTLDKEIQVEITEIKKELLRLCERENKFQYYHLRGYFLNNTDTEATQVYYTDLKNRGVMIENENPFILAWNVSNLWGDIMKAAIATSDETIAADGTRVYNEGNTLVVDTPAGSRIMIYSVGGRMEADRLADGVQHFQLPKGIYFVHITKGNTSKVYKTIKR